MAPNLPIPAALTTSALQRIRSSGDSLYISIIIIEDAMMDI